MPVSITIKNQANSKSRSLVNHSLGLLKIILFAYSKGITSSREIEWSCETNIIFKALSCDTVPHFTTIASFVSSHALEIENLFEQILLICDEQGLLGRELFAIDGCKMPSDASKEWSGTFKELEQKRIKLKKLIHHHVTKHKKLDKAYKKIDQFLKTAQPRQVFAPAKPAFPASLQVRR